MTTQSTDSKLKALGFSDDIVQEPYRLIASVSGLEKSGKTHFSLTAPEPIIFFNIDIGTEGVVGKFQRGFDGHPAKQVYIYDVRFSKNSANTGDYKPLWLDLKDKLARAWALDKGTVVMDTASEAHELSRLAAFGKLTQVLPHHYGPVNAEWRDLIRLAYDSDMNTILIHKLKPTYVENVRTRDYDVKGFAETGYLVQANITTYYDAVNGEFAARVENCRQNADLRGEVLHGPMSTFEFLLARAHSK